MDVKSFDSLFFKKQDSSYNGITLLCKYSSVSGNIRVSLIGPKASTKWYPYSPNPRKWYSYVPLILPQCSFDAHFKDRGDNSKHFALMSMQNVKK